MKTLVAIVMGFFSGLLIYFMGFMLFADVLTHEGPSIIIFVFVTFFGGWAVSAWTLRRGARSISKVFSRGFLLGAAEWLVMIFVGLVFSSKAVSSTVTSTSSGAEAAGAVLGGGFVVFITGAVSIFMAVVCLIGFTISYFIGREMKPEASSPIKKCPQCAEMIQQEARKCRYCGADLIGEELQTQARTKDLTTAAADAAREEFLNEQHWRATLTAPGRSKIEHDLIAPVDLKGEELAKFLKEQIKKYVARNPLIQAEGLSVKFARVDQDRVLSDKLRANPGKWENRVMKKNIILIVLLVIVVMVGLGVISYVTTGVKKTSPAAEVSKSTHEEIKPEEVSLSGSPEITSFSGSGGLNTKPFITTGPWEIQWDAKGDLFQLLIHTATGDLIGVAANQQGSGKGASYQPQAGDYYLQVNAIGNWSIKIISVVETPIIKDVDGNVYQTVKIGNQVWIAENLRTTKFNDGTPIPQVTDGATWANLSTSGYCLYNNNISNKDKYGTLYNWYAVDTKKLAPKGWHVPTDADWDKLKNYLIDNGYNWDGTKIDNKIAKAMAAKTDWNIDTKPGTIGNDLSKNNKSCFSALPGGSRDLDGLYVGIGFNGYWWSATENDAANAFNRDLYFDYSGLLFRFSFNKRCGFYVRLLRDN